MLYKDSLWKIFHFLLQEVWFILKCCFLLVSGPSYMLLFCLHLKRAPSLTPLSILSHSFSTSAMTVAVFGALRILTYSSC